MRLGASVNGRPNVIIITTDQQRFDSLSCYGSGGFASTPNIDRLGELGAVFHRAYCTNPVCTPARASIFSGSYPSRHGAWNVGMSVPEDVPMLSHTLGQAGYRTHYVGKAHFQAFGDRTHSRECRQTWNERNTGWHGPYYGFETVELSLGHTTNGLYGHYGEWLRERLSEEAFAGYLSAERADDGPGFSAEAYDWDLPVRYHSSTWTADRALAFLEGYDADEPFLLGIGFQDPHHPHCVPRDQKERVSPDTVPLPRFVEGELADKPPHFGLVRRGAFDDSPFRGTYPLAGQHRNPPYQDLPEQSVRNARAYYYSMVALIDTQIGRILSALESSGRLKDTVIVFTTDHGELLGDHGLWLKGPFHYEELVRIPFIVAWPAGFAGGVRVHDLVSQADLVPTILDAVGAAPLSPSFVDGVSLLDLVRGGSSPKRPAVMVECVDDPTGLRLKTAITERYKLTHYHGHAFGELYDLAEDPGEVTNRWDDPAYVGVRNELLGTLVDHAERLERRATRFSYA